MLIEKIKKNVLVHGVVEETLFDGFRGRKVKDVIILEGRPGLQAARSNSRALLKRKISPTLIADNMAGFLFFKNWVKEIWIAYQASGQQGALCPIGAMILGVLGKSHGVPVYLYPVAEKSRFFGRPKDLFCFEGVRVAPNRAKGYVPLLEWLPVKYITKIYPKDSHE
ncbi:MAG: hypothetical protein Q8Q08_12150 [Candidatus Omnitrophota bacterium]|nr:hypothetical protein [Candidatus Omnitrophota bacterium]MDZ4241624.1 hypothetical protein [Candidatus Omnitrophota bacterium]